MIQPGIKAAAELLALRSVDSLIEGGVVCVLAWVTLRIVPRQSAASRFAVWFSALMAIGFGALLGAVWPSAEIVGSADQHAAITIPETWPLYLVGGWAVISLWMLIGLARSLWYLRNLRKSCTPIDALALHPLIRQTLCKLGQSVTLCTSNEVKIPAAIGFWNRTIVVPAWAIRELSPDELNQIVLHELAHLRRFDDWTSLAQQIIKALFFFHPAVWWIERKASLEREIACDDAVLEETARPRAYAECLARLAERSLVHRSLSMAQAALGKFRQMSTRVAQILDPNRPARTGAVWLPAASLVVIAAVGCSAWYSRSPKLIAFGGERSGPALSVAQMATMPASETTLAATAVKVTPVLLSEKRNRPRIAASRHLTAARATAMVPVANHMVHLTSAKASSVPVTETMWIVVERNESIADYQVVQIQMWHVTILRDSAAASSLQIPRKI